MLTTDDLCCVHDSLIKYAHSNDSILIHGCRIMDPNGDEEWIVMDTDGELPGGADMVAQLEESRGREDKVTWIWKAQV